MSAREVRCEPHDEDHGPARRDETRLWWRCETCGRVITDEDLARMRAPADAPVVMT